ncbi:MAG: hypothetical protein EOP58_16725 [Sphingomonadales bacterium]|nr:MAG: hypothetical protein EOP58_16725 [Sphingomonadales bacterium]
MLVSNDAGIGKVYIDMASVKPDAEGRIAIRKHLFEKPREDGAIGVMTETVFRCESKELRETTKTWFRANGSVAETGQSYSARWISTESSPDRTKMLDMVCAKKL